MLAQARASFVEIHYRINDALELRNDSVPDLSHLSAPDADWHDVALPFDWVNDFLFWCQTHPRPFAPSALVRDIARQCPRIDGETIFVEYAYSNEFESPKSVTASWSNALAHRNRPLHWTDRLLLTEMCRAIDEGWDGPVELKSLVADFKRSPSRPTPRLVTIDSFQQDGPWQPRSVAERPSGTNNSITIESIDDWIACGAADYDAAEFERDQLEKFNTWRAEQHNLRDAAQKEWLALVSSGAATQTAVNAWHEKYKQLALGFNCEMPSVKIMTSERKGMPLLDTQNTIADIGHPHVETFIAAQSGRPASDAPKLPDVLAEHPLFETINIAIAHAVAIAERSPKSFRASAAVDMLAVLHAVHEPTFQIVCARILAAGAPLPESRTTAAVRRFEYRIGREIRTASGWTIDNKGFPDNGNTDNVGVFLRIIGADVRWNAWSQRIEKKQTADGPWEPLQDRDFSNLLTTAGNGQHNFRPRESMFKRAITALANETIFDPVLARIDAAQSAWDGVPRLDTWLSRSCHVPDDAYHRAVGRSLIGGMCKRARRPGCKHDETVILIGSEDTLKSTFCRTLALQDEWFSDSVAFEGSPQNIVPQLFGKLVIELAELDGMARREIQYIKRFLSAQSDNVTLKYEAFASDHARRCIFIGTSNEHNPLRGDTGNRRFLPVRIEKRIDIEFLQANLTQILGEAATLEAAGEKFLIPYDVIPEARARQDEARSESDYEIYLRTWFADGATAAYVLPADISTALRDATGRSVPSGQYGAIMRRLGFIQMKPRLDGEQTRIWLRGSREGARRYAICKGVDGRMALKTAPSAQPAVPSAGATILPIVRNL